MPSAVVQVSAEVNAGLVVQKQESQDLPVVSPQVVSTVSRSV